jgi:SPX domain protein involved in polyphosphate accumulation
MRLRSYGQQPNFPAFIEIKEKANQWVRKRRAPITSVSTVEFLRNGSFEYGNKDVENPYMREASYKILMRGLKPKLMTQYQRRAYFGRFETYTRVTFDRRMRCYPEDDYNIFPDEEKFANYDHGWRYTDFQSSVVLELKCEAKAPHWMFDIIRQFELKHLQFSKYDSAWTYASQSDLEFRQETFDLVAPYGI